MIGGFVDVADRFISPTVIKNVSADAAIMQDEIFGPLLPVLTINNVRDGINFVNSRFVACCLEGMI